MRRSVAAGAAIATVAVAVGGYLVLSDGRSEDAPHTASVDPRCKNAGPSVKEAGGNLGDDLRAPDRELCTQARRQGVTVAPARPGARDAIRVSYALEKPLTAGASLDVSMLVREDRVTEGCTRLMVAKATASKGSVVFDVDDGDGDGTLPVGKRRWCVGTASFTAVRSDDSQTAFIEERVPIG